MLSRALFINVYGIKTDVTDFIILWTCWEMKDLVWIMQVS